MDEEGRRKNGNRNRECVLIRVPHPFPPIAMSGQQIQSNIWVKEIILSMQFTNKSSPRFPISLLTPLPLWISFIGIQKGKILSPCPRLFCQFRHSPGHALFHLFWQHWPVICKWFIVLSIKGSSSSKHDSGVQICNYPRHSTGCSNTGLCAFVPCLEGR